MFGAMPTREKLNRMRADQRRKMLLLGAGGTTCAVCGHPKAGGRPLCEECLGTLPRADWDLLISDSDGFRQIVEAMTSGACKPGTPCKDRSPGSSSTADISPADKQEQFRLDMGNRSFGRNENGSACTDERTPASVLDILMKSKEFRQFIAEIVKAARG